jgi:hypothetical protein
MRQRDETKASLDAEEAAKALRIPPIFLAQLIYEGRLRLRKGFLLRREDVESLRDYSRRRFEGLES